MCLQCSFFCKKYDKGFLCEDIVFYFHRFHNPLFLKFCFSQEPVHRPGCTGSCFSLPFGLENLARESQLLFGRKCLVKFLHVSIVHIVALGRLVNAGDTVEVTGDQLFA